MRNLWLQLAEWQIDHMMRWSVANLSPLSHTRKWQIDHQQCKSMANWEPVPSDFFRNHCLKMRAGLFDQLFIIRVNVRGEFWPDFFMTSILRVGRCPHHNHTSIRTSAGRPDFVRWGESSPSPVQNVKFGPDKQTLSCLWPVLHRHTLWSQPIWLQRRVHTSRNPEILIYKLSHWTLWLQCHIPTYNVISVTRMQLLPLL